MHLLSLMPLAGFADRMNCAQRRLKQIESPWAPTNLTNCLISPHVLPNVRGVLGGSYPLRASRAMHPTGFTRFPKRPSVAPVDSYIRKCSFWPAARAGTAQLGPITLAPRKAAFFVSSWNFSHSSKTSLIILEESILQMLECN